MWSAQPSYHLRRFIGQDPKWRVFARLHVLRTGHYIDLLIFRKKCPMIALELKWNQDRVIVRLDRGTDFERWKRGRQDYRSKMGPGRGSKLRPTTKNS